MTIGIGLWAAKRVKNTADYAIAGRHLPLIMIVTTTFATWFGSETVLGIGAKFVQGNLGTVVEDPFGASFCLIFVGLFFAAKLYKQTLLHHQRLLPSALRQIGGNPLFDHHHAELSRLGCGAGHGLGLVFNILAWRHQLRMGHGDRGRSILDLHAVRWHVGVALTDFIQMIVLVVGCPSSPSWPAATWPAAPTR